MNTAARWIGFVTVGAMALWACGNAHAALLAGVAKVDITDYEAGPVNDPLYVKALVLEDESTTMALVTVDAVAIGEIGRIGNDYLPTVRSRIESELGIEGKHVIVNASHCHGVVHPDVAARTVEAVSTAAASLTPVRVGAGVGHEDRVMENRRFRLKDGTEADSRHAYSMPWNDEVASVGPVDPELGLLRLDREDGSTLAVVYNFAMHPIQGVPSGGNTADVTGFASRTIESQLGCTALFVQGCAGDINPVWYKDVHHPRDAEPLGTMLGLSALEGLRAIACTDDAPFRVVHETLPLPRADRAARIKSLEEERLRLVDSLGGTSLNFETFMPLYVKYRLSPEFPTHYSHGYLHEEAIGRQDLSKLDAENRANMERYLENVRTMERLTRVQTNLALLRKHYADNAAAGMGPIEVEVAGFRVGDFVMITFPGELTVPIGLSIKEASPHALTFVAGYTNGYIYYAPTAEQLRNAGGAQEDSDCILAPEWQEQFEAKALTILEGL